MSNPTQAIFTPPAANVDGSAISAGEIVKYMLEVGLVPTDGSAQTFPAVFADLDVTPNADGTIAIPLDDLGPLAPGNYMGVVVAVTGAGVSAKASDPAAFTIEAPVVTPNPCTGLKFV